VTYLGDAAASGAQPRPQFSEGRCIPRFQVYQTSAHKGRLLVWRSVKCDAQGLNARSNAGVKNVSRSFHALGEPQQSTRLGPPRNSSCSRSKDGTCPMRLPCFLAFWFLPLSTLWPTSSFTPVPPVPNSCSRFSAGSVVHNPPALFSQNGYLSVRFSYQTRTDDEGRTLFSFMTPDGLENPTLYVHPGDHLIVTITNNTPATPIEMPAPPPTCGGSVMTHSSVNIHFHGTNTSPVCGQDEVIHTVINSGETFQ
jgi:hypothetical protein